VRDRSAAAPLVTDRESIGLLGETLGAAGYDLAGFRRVLGTDQTRIGPSERETYLRRLPPGERLSTLIRLFFLGVHVPVDEAAAALAPVEPRRLEDANVLRASALGLEATLDVTPFENVLVAGDPGGTATRADQTTAVSGASLTLASVTARGRVARALDLGTGSGVQALLLAQHADTVVATDVNARALAYAAFNTALNRIENIDLREGSLFEPVAGETFDLVVSNPPYVISPDTDFLFRDSGLPGDSFCEAVVRQVGDHLADGGLAQVLVNWIVPPGREWSDPLRRWVGGGGCDALLLRQSLWDPLGYAATWNAPLRGDPEAFGAALDRWVGHFRSVGIETIAGGLVALRKRAGTRSVVALEVPAARLEPAGDQIIRLLTAQEFLGGRTDDALLAERLAPAAELAVDVRLAPRRRASLSLDCGLALRVDVDETTVGLIAALGSGDTLADALERAHLDRDEALSAIRRLVELGLVVPA
jgi:methylase of polypeptide subunit release factors